MTDFGSEAPNTAAVSQRLVRLAGWCAYASGIVSIFSVVFFVAFFTLGGLFGPLSDIAVTLHYVLMLPIAFTLQQLLRPHGPGFSLVGMLIGIVGMLAVIVLQILLVAGVLTFGQQIGMLMPAFLLVLAWFVINAYLDRSTDFVPSSMLFNVLAGLYIAYPFWGYSVGRRLLSLSRDSESASG